MLLKNGLIDFANFKVSCSSLHHFCMRHIALRFKPGFSDVIEDLPDYYLRLLSTDFMEIMAYKLKNKSDLIFPLTSFFPYFEFSLL